MENKNIDKVEKGKLKDIFGFIANRFDIEPDYLRAVLITNFPELKDKTTCANCGASMEMYVYTVDCIDALLLYRMGKLVRSRMSKGMDFTDANEIHLTSALSDTGYTILSHQTIASKHGLIAKIRNENGSHNRAKGWCITKRGFSFLKGEPVPKKVKVWRNKITEYVGETTTIQEAFRTHADTVQKAIKARKDPKYDYRSEMDEYKASDWYDFGGLAQGNLI